MLLLSKCYDTKSVKSLVDQANIPLVGVRGGKPKKNHTRFFLVPKLNNMPKILGGGGYLG